MTTVIVRRDLPSKRPAPLSLAAGILAELVRREPVLARFGLLLIGLMVPAGLALALDGRTLDGVAVWAKPVKFLASVGLYALTLAWFHGCLPEGRRRDGAARAIAWTVVAAGGFEIAYISFQAALGEASHFNLSTPFHATMYGLMGIGAVALTATSPALAWRIARHGDAGTPAAYRLAVVLGLVLTFALGAAFGAYMSAQPGHAVGAVAGGATLPVLGWSMTGGDLRVAHFLGVHAQQAIPAAGAAAALLLRRRWAGAAVWAFSLAYALLAVAAFAGAVMGVPLMGA
jgi:hypothetical protein